MLNKQIPGCVTYLMRLAGASRLATRYSHAI